MITAESTLLEDLKSENKSLKNEVAYLKEQINWFHRQVFGQKREKIIKDLNDPGVQYLPGMKEWIEEQLKQEEIELKQVKAHTRVVRKMKGQDQISFPENLPVERVELDVSEEEKVCPKTGESLQKIGEEVSRKLAQTPGSFYIKEYVRPKYAKKEGEGIVVAEMPDSIIPKCRADESLLAEILTQKYADHLPLYRISEALARSEINISRQVLSQWVIRLGKGLKPLYELMKKKILDSGNAFADETPVKLLIPGKGKAHQAYMWVLAGGKSENPANRIYVFKKDRKHENATDLIGKYNGVLHSDKYGAYQTLAERKEIIWSPCWSHIRRKFFEAEVGDPVFRKWVLRKIRYLFMLEKVAWNCSEERRLQIRKEKEVPIIDELIHAIRDKLYNGRILPKSKFREALGYFTSLIPYLKNYTNHPWARMDNNVAERAVRPLAIGRKNWLFAGSEHGGEATAVILSLVQTCRALKINPREYLEDILRRIQEHPFNRLDELLPENWAQEKR